MERRGHTKECIDVVARLHVRRVGTEDKADTPVHKTSIRFNVVLMGRMVPDATEGTYGSPILNGSYTEKQLR